VSEQGAKGFSTKPRNVVQIVARPGVQLDSLNKAIALAVGQTGCRTCGLIGVDLHLVGGDPAFDQVRGIEGIDAVVTQQGG
jgi:hypothetical protein